MAFLSACSLQTHRPPAGAGPLTCTKPTSNTCSRRPRIIPLCSAQAKSEKSRPSPKRSGTKATPSPENQEAAKAFLLSLGVSNEDTRRMLTRLPRLAFEDDLPTVAAPILLFLRSALRMNRKQIARALRFAPQIIYRESDKFTENLQFLDTVARIPASDQAAAIAKCPHVLWMDLELASRVIQLVVDACPLITPSALGSVFARVPQALVTPPARIGENIGRIKAAGVCDAASMARVIAKAPLALVYSASNTIDKRIQYLSTELQLPTSTVGKVLVAVPQVLDWSIDKLLRPRIQLLASVVGANSVAGVVDKVPMLLDVDDAIDRVLWLREQVGLTDEQIGIVIRQAPAVLTYSVVGNLAPKWAFISETMGGTGDDVTLVPRESLCANLQQRAMPRYAFLTSRGRHDINVVDVLKGSDVEFCKNVAQCDAALFREYVDNDTYLLFFSQLI